jgi:hypothetical protein
MNNDLKVDFSLPPMSSVALVSAVECHVQFRPVWVFAFPTCSSLLVTGLGAQSMFRPLRSTSFFESSAQFVRLTSPRTWFSGIDRSNVKTSLSNKLL